MANWRQGVRTKRSQRLSSSNTRNPLPLVGKKVGGTYLVAAPSILGIPVRSTASIKLRSRVT